jgi:hypothetical protein
MSARVFRQLPVSRPRAARQFVSNVRQSIRKVWLSAALGWDSRGAVSCRALPPLVGKQGLGPRCCGRWCFAQGRNKKFQPPRPVVHKWQGPTLGHPAFLTAQASDTTTTTAIRRGCWTLNYLR